MMKLCDWNEKVQIERFFFVFFSCFSGLLFVNYYCTMIVHKTGYIVNFFALILSIKLFCILTDVVSRVVMIQIVQLMSAGLMLLLLNFFPVPLWIIVFVNTLFALVYFYFLHLHKNKSKQRYRLIQSYVSLVHLFYLFYLLTLSVQLFFGHQEDGTIRIVLNYLQVGLQLLLLVLSMTSYLFYSNLLHERSSQVSFGWSKQEKEQNKASKSGYIGQNQAATAYQFSYKHQLLVEQLIAFFETNEAYLKHDFTLEVLAEYLSTPNVDLLNFVIKNHLHTTFYKLVAYYRILYALQIFAQRQDWSIGAIAESVGFKSVNTFSKYFVEMTGLTPVEYRIVLERKRG